MSCRINHVEHLRHSLEMLVQPYWIAEPYFRALGGLQVSKARCWPRVSASCPHETPTTFTSPFNIYKTCKPHKVNNILKFTNATQ